MIIYQKYLNILLNEFCFFFLSLDLLQDVY